ncbi:hypothetical+protein [Methylocapsa aurea]
MAMRISSVLLLLNGLVVGRAAAQPPELPTLPPETQQMGDALVEDGKRIDREFARSIAYERRLRRETDREARRPAANAAPVNPRTGVDCRKTTPNAGCRQWESAFAEELRRKRYRLPAVGPGRAIVSFRIGARGDYRSIAVAAATSERYARLALALAARCHVAAPPGLRSLTGSQELVFD